MRAAIFLLSVCLTLTPVAARAQWDIQTSHTTADLRGIFNVGSGVAWASGTSGTVLRTEDNGATWQPCTVPTGAEHLDFRGIQAFDETTAIVMSSGTGDQSRLYKTTDSCKTWTLLLTNTDKDGFWDALLFRDADFGVLLGDPVNGRLYSRYTTDGGETWQPFINDDLLRTTSKLAGIFAASNSSILMPENHTIILAAANLETAAAIFSADSTVVPCHKLALKAVIGKNHCTEYTWWKSGNIPLTRTGETSGLFAIAMDPSDPGGSSPILAVGGDYSKPDDPGASAVSFDQLANWTPSTTPPHGFRSAVAYDSPTATWITIGPNGTDISTDSGRNWQPLMPTPGEAPDAAQHWNALSLPFVVGPHGRIGTLRPLPIPKPPTPPSNPLNH